MPDRAGGCEAMRLLMQADLDGELDAAGAATLAGHVAGCAECAASRDDFSRLSARVKGEVTRYAASPALRRAVLARVPRQLPRRLRDGAWFGAGMALAAGVASLLLSPPRTEDVLAAHLRALQPGHLLDVESTDRHTVKPWFAGKLDYSPPVVDFSAQGFPLVGGRLDYVAGRPVAVMVYRRDKHLIDLFVWPGDTVAASKIVRGYDVEAWSRNGMTFRAVSDLNAAELADFRRLVIGGG